MKDKEFEISIPRISETKQLFSLIILMCVLILDSIYINKYNFESNKSYAYSDKIGIVDKPSAITIYNNKGKVEATKSSKVNVDDIIDIYVCKNSNCKVIDLNTTSKELLALDEDYTLYNYDTKDKASVNIDVKEYQDIKFVENDLYIKNEDKYAIFDLKNNNYLTDFIYDNILIRTFNGIEESVFGGYTNNSKYNQILDIYNKNNEIIKHYNHCTKLEQNDQLYCNEHVEGTITNEEVDKTLDIILEQYPDLNDTRFYEVKNAIETVGLPYLWGGGHSTLKNTLDIANKNWGKKMVFLSKGFDRQEGGKEYPAGLDCAGFVRWVIYSASGVDLYKDHINVISGRNKDVTLINKEDLLPGDIILDKDHVVIYLYKDQNNNPISVHAALGSLKVEISHYKRGNRYYRLNAWM